MRKTFTAAALFVLIAAAVCMAGVPDGMKGFKGYLIGRIVSVDAEGVRFKVTGVVPMDASKAENPRCVVGEEIRILFKFFMGKDGRYEIDRELMDWVFKLMKEGDLVTLRVFVDGNSFIMDKAWHGAREKPEQGDKEEPKRDKEEPKRDKEREKEREKEGDGEPGKLPEGARGFSGMVRGIVVGKKEGVFIFKVARIMKVWEGNKAKNPESLIGKTITIGPGWVKGGDGKWHPVERHVRFIRLLKVGDEINIEIANREGDRFNILELNEEQRRAADGGEGEKEGRKEPEREKEGEREEQARKEREGKEGKLPEKGAVVGEVVGLKDTSFKLKVREASKGCQVLEGETLEFLVNWIKRGDKWVPDPKEIKAFGELRLGDTVRVEFYRDEHWRVKKMQVVKRAGKKRIEELRKEERKRQEREKEEQEKKEREKK